METKFTVSFEIYNTESVKRLQEEDPDILPSYSVDAAQDLANNKKQISAAITAGIIQGKSIDHIADDLQSRIETLNRASAIRTARTAITNAQNAGTLASMKRLAALGVEVQKEWMATLDSRTRESHRNLDGERRELDERFSNGLMYPGASGSAKEVYNCRCTMVSYLPKYDSEDEPRVTYSEWTEYKKASGSVSGKISGEEYAKATTWNNKRKTTVNKARAIDSIHLSFGAGAYKYTPESIIQEMEKSPVGQKAIETVETSYVSITIANGEWSTGCRGESYRNDIILYQNNIGSVRVAAQTLIHEITK